MNFSGNVSNRGAATGSRKSGKRKGYDDLAGSSVLRRTGKSAASETPMRGDKTTTLLAARRKVETDERVGRQLRDFYQSIMREPVPERFVALLGSLEAGNGG
jgi:hypothetical protein